MKMRAPGVVWTGVAREEEEREEGEEADREERDEEVDVGWGMRSPPRAGRWKLTSAAYGRWNVLG